MGKEESQGGSSSRAPPTDAGIAPPPFTPSLPVPPECLSQAPHEGCRPDTAPLHRAYSGKGETNRLVQIVTRCDRCCEGSMQGAVAKNNARVLVHLSGDLTGTEGRSRERGWAVAQLEWGRCEDGHCDLSERT